MPTIKSLGSFSLVNTLVFLVMAPGFAQTAIPNHGTNQPEVHPPSTTSLTPDAVVAQRRRDADDRINYFGIGGTIGVSDDGDTELGDGGFSLVGRFSLNDSLSIHSASVLGGDNFASFALTTSFPGAQNVDQVNIHPFVGAGVGVEFDGFELSPLVSAGVDIPINDLITGTARVNAAFNDGTDIGVVLGVGIDALSLF